MGGPEQVEELVRQLRLYVRAHPRAADNLDGIERWWLSLPAFAVSHRDLQAALDRLVSEGVVNKTTLPDGTDVYFGAPE